MYQVSIFNNGIETIIHYPSAEEGTPHLIKIPFKESLSLPDILSFSLYPNNIGYNKIEGLITKVKVINTRDNKVMFTGRAMPVKSNMDSNGLFYKEVSCEGGMAYLNDTQTRRWNLSNQTPTQLLTYLLNEHNLKVDASRRIYIGTINVTQPITVDCNYETTLNTIVSKIRNVLGGDLRVRETNGLLYLDYLVAQGNDNGVEVKLGYNMKSLIEEDDPLDIITRGIILGYGEGINQLDIKKINNNIEYLDNPISMAKYGVIEGVITNLDIQNADTLKIYGATVLAEKSQTRLTLGIGSLDLSVLTGHENEDYSNGDNIKILNEFMNIDALARVIEREFDFLAPQDKALTISTRSITLSDQIIELKQRNLSLENAPQGNTCIFPINIAENADAAHSINIDLDIPKETININRIYINLHGRKYRAYEKGLSAGSSSTATSASSGGSTQTSAGGGNHRHKMFEYQQYGLIIDTISPFLTANSAGGLGCNVMMRTDVTQDLYTAGPSGTHTHTTDIPAHTHEATTPGHAHAIDYGIFESTYPNNIKIRINGTDFGVNYGDGSNEINLYDIDITQYINIGNNKIEISTSQNGRIEAIIYSQIFIQSK